MRNHPPTTRLLLVALVVGGLLGGLLLGRLDATAGPAESVTGSYTERILQGRFVVSGSVFGAAGDGVITMLDPPELSPVTPVLPQP